MEQEDDRWPPEGGEGSEHSFEVEESGDIYSVKYSGVNGDVLDTATILEVREKIKHDWGGVTSCCKTSRINAEVNGRFNKWVSEQIAAHPNAQILNKSHSRFVGKCLKWDDRPLGGRGCMAWGSMECLITFYIL